jgi:FMN-dependent NADH-azoreductase
MATLLRIDSSALGDGASFSRELTGEYAGLWQNNHPGGTVITRDLAATELRPVNSAWIAAARQGKGDPSVLALSDQLIAELQAADEYVIGVAMYNFSIPAVLKLWIDQVVRGGKTFSYEGGKPAGLLLGKKATILVASGGVYEQNFIEPYLRALFGFIGVSDVRFLYASGTAKANFGVGRDAILQPARASLRAATMGV